MKKTITTLSLIVFAISMNAQSVMTPEKLVEVGKLSGSAVTKDGKSVVFNVRKYSNAEAKATTKKYIVPIAGGTATEIEKTDGLIVNDRLSPDGKYSISSNDIKVKKIYGSDFYPQLPKSDVMIIDNLDYRHWDTWEDGAFGHVFVNTLKDGKITDSVDLMPNEPYDCPQKPYGGDEDFIWSKDGKQVLYVTKKKYGTAYAISTNTDIYSYDIATKQTTNLTEGMMGYDTKPAYSSTGTLAFLSMKTDGYEADKNDIIVMNGTTKINLTGSWDGTVDDFKWSNDGKKVYFIAADDGTLSVYSIDYPVVANKTAVIKKITNGDFDVRAFVGQVGNTMIVERTDMNHAAELYAMDLTTGAMKQLSHINDALFNSVSLGKVERRYLTATDGEPLLVWVIYPPNFDKTKKYPTLLYCQGGPQSPLTQFYSFRWNFQLMAASGYIVVAPNRRGMPGHGVKWNEQISRDYGGQNMKDYLISIDELSKEPYVDKNKLGCVGASYGGYSVFFLEGIHEKRFKSFIAHDGIFDSRSMYGNTEELWFVNTDYGGPYWDRSNIAAQRSYNEFNPANYVEKWDTPILIIQGGKDYRCPIEQGLGAFQAAQLRGIKSKLLYFPNENHWISKEQDALVWQHEFYNWLSETLK